MGDKKIDQIDERIQKLKEENDKKIQQLKEQKKAILAKEREKRRKAETREKIIMGGILKRMGIDTPEKAEALEAVLTKNPENFERLIAKINNHIEKKGDLENGQ